MHSRLNYSVNETFRKMCNLPFSFLSVTCSPPLAYLFSVCSLVVIEDIFSFWFHSISQQHLKGVVIALHLKSAFRRVFIVILTTLSFFSFTSSSHVLF